MNINNISEMIDYIQTRKRTEKKVSLDRMKAFCSICDNPQVGIKYIHVGGTNGKGSVVSFLKNILLKQGFHVGAYISPYVVCFNERISFDGKYISDEEILYFGNLIISKQEDFNRANLPQPTFFEFVTLMAFLYFKSKKDLDYVILEVGLGGLLDCTNIITPLVSIISNVSYDHMNVLGDTLEEIASNKLGIVKENNYLVTLDNKELNKLFIEKCKEKNAKLILVKKEDIKNVSINDNLMTFTYKDYHVKSKLLGLYQTENIAISIETIELLNRLKEFAISKETILSGISETFWPGRFQVVNQKPLIVIDGAHNIDGITRLCETIKKIKEDRKVTIIFAVSKDKEKEVMIKKLSEIADSFYFSSFNYKRSDDPQLLMNLATFTNKMILDDLDEFINKIRSSNSDEIYVFCGSLYFVSELLPKFK